MADAAQAKPLTTKISTFAFWTVLGIIEWLYRPINPVSRLLHGAMLVIAVSLATFSAIGLIRIWLLRSSRN